MKASDLVTQMDLKGKKLYVMLSHELADGTNISIERELWTDAQETFADSVSCYAFKHNPETGDVYRVGPVTFSDAYTLIRTWAEDSVRRSPVDVVKAALRSASLEDVNYPEDTTEMWLGDDVRLLDTEGLSHFGENVVALLALYLDGSEGDTYVLKLEAV